MKILLVRAGQFKAYWNRFDGVCGYPDETPQKYNYRCEIDADQDALDKNGFVIDQLYVDNLFQTALKRPADGISCERMAIKMVNVIFAAIDSPYVLRVKVSVGVIPPPRVVGEAMISAEWIR